MGQLLRKNTEPILSCGNRLVAQRIQMLHIGFYPFKGQQSIINLFRFCGRLLLSRGLFGRLLRVGSRYGRVDQAGKLEILNPHSSSLVAASAIEQNC